MIFPDVMGAPSARATLARFLATGRIPHALLFHGPEGIGKSLVAGRFAASLVCLDPQPDGSACGRCSACRKVEHGNHPDVLTLTRLPKKDKQSAAPDEPDDDEDEPSPSSKAGALRTFIIVSQIRELTRHASYAPREAARRVFIVDPADRMHAESQNALLKTLEEPPGSAVILLVTSRPHVLLATVRSRCFQVGFVPMTAEALAAALVATGMNRPEAESRAALAEGRPGRALSLDLPGLSERRDELLDALWGLASRSPEAVARLSDHAESVLGETEDDLLEGLDMIEGLLRDAARAAAGLPSIAIAEAGSRVAALGREIGALRAMEIVALADRLRGDLRLNLNKMLVCETILAAVAGGPTELPSFDA